jgi:hypothetical protein
LQTNDFSQSGFVEALKVLLNLKERGLITKYFVIDFSLSSNTKTLGY